MTKYLLVAALALSSSQAVAADSLAGARDLYASASYEEALAMLGRLNAAELPPDEGRAADQYRALCLLALGKTAEASQAIEAVVAAYGLTGAPAPQSIYTDRYLPPAAERTVPKGAN